MTSQVTETDFATTRDGTRISYRLVPGNGSGGRCVLIHSLAMDKSFWSSTIEALGGAADVLVVDCRGHGKSDKPAGPYSVEQFAGDIADVMDHVGWDKAVVAGASMGGCVTLAFGSYHPDRVSGLGLFDTTAWYGDNAPAVWAERGSKALAEGLSSLVPFQKTRWFGDAFREANPEVLDAAIAVFLANDLPAYAATCGMLGSADLRAYLPKFDFPCEIRVGSEDYATPPEMAQSLADNIPGSKMEIMEGVRHFSPLEVPHLIADALTKLTKAS
jgi:3-oxoadipate enol-lactonase